MHYVDPNHQEYSNQQFAYVISLGNIKLRSRIVLPTPTPPIITEMPIEDNEPRDVVKKTLAQKSI